MKDEQKLIQLAQSLGDDDAFSALVKIYQSKIRIFLVRLCKNYDIADDLAQDTFIAAHKKLSTYQEEGKFQAWLFRIAYNCFLMQHRKSSRHKEILDTYEAEYKVLTDKYDSLKTNQLDIEQAMSRLGYKESAAISLCFSFGYSHKEASVILDLPVGTIKSNIRRGKSEMLKFLTHQGSVN